MAHSVVSWLPTTMNWVYNQIQYTPGFTPIVLTNDRANEQIYPLEHVYQVPGAPLATLRRLRDLFGLRSTPALYQQAVKRHNVQILHSHFGDRAWFDRPLARKHGLRHVVTFYGYDVNKLPRNKPYWRWRYRELFAEADLFLCEGPFMARCLVDLGCPQHKVRVQRLGVEVEKIAYRPRQLRPGEPLRILIAGSFREKKGIPYAVEAVGMLYAEHPQLALTIIGDSSGNAAEVREKRAILETISRYNLGPVTRLLGYQPYSHLLEEAYQSHIFLSPSVTASDGDTEGGAPVSLIDMAASGMPIVSTTHCDIPGIVGHGTNGLLAPERDAATLVQHLRWLLRHPECWQAMAQAGRQRIAADFDARKQGVGLAKYYQQYIYFGWR
ncbi:colanic acid biosynthesis glycosyltransferase WcaL [Candidatus Gracilibacteria bacterium]|nr:colanic acid biosynthesis glycosyltransferase WcaL [Candidatus Gracilibacteria bacterium]